MFSMFGDGWGHPAAYPRRQSAYADDYYRRREADRQARYEEQARRDSREAATRRRHARQVAAQRQAYAEEVARQEAAMAAERERRQQHERDFYNQRSGWPFGFGGPADHVTDLFGDRRYANRDATAANRRAAKEQAEAQARVERIERRKRNAAIARFQRRVAATRIQRAWRAHRDRLTLKYYPPQDPRIEVVDESFEIPRYRVLPDSMDCVVQPLLVC